MHFEAECESCKTLTWSTVTIWSGELVSENTPGFDGLTTITTYSAVQKHEVSICDYCARKYVYFKILQTRAIISLVVWFVFNMAVDYWARPIRLNPNLLDHGPLLEFFPTFAKWGLWTGFGIIALFHILARWICARALKERDWIVDSKTKEQCAIAAASFRILSIEADRRGVDTDKLRETLRFWGFDLASKLESKKGGYQF